MMNNTNQEIAKDVDLVLVPGGDRGILNYFHKMSVESAPVLGHIRIKLYRLSSPS